MRNFDAILEKLHLHHSIEDSQVFPPLRKARPDLGEEVGVLESDHKVL